MNNTKPAKPAKRPDKEVERPALPVVVGLAAEVSLTVVEPDEVGVLGALGVVDAMGAVAEFVGVRVVGVPPGVPGTVEAAEAVVESLAELDVSSFSVITKGELIARTLPMFETSTNWRVKSEPAAKRGRGTPTEPREVCTLLATPMLGLN